jgi:hypothetical protein
MHHSAPRAPRGIARAVVVVLTVVALGGCTVDGPTDSVEEYPTRNAKVAVLAWLEAVCPAAVDAGDVVAEVFAVEPGAEGFGSKKGRERLRRELVKGLVEARGKLVGIDHRVADAGIPRTGGGFDLVGRARNAIERTRDRLASAAAATRKVDTADAEAFQAGLQRALGALQTEGSPLGEVAVSLRQDPAFNVDMAAIDSCTGL